MFPKPKASLKPNTYAYESEPMVKATGFREYDARWLFGSEINLMGVEALGFGLGTLMYELGVKPQLVTGHDFRSDRRRSRWRWYEMAPVEGHRARRPIQDAGRRRL